MPAVGAAAGDVAQGVAAGAREEVRVARVGVLAGAGRGVVGVGQRGCLRRVVVRAQPALEQSLSATYSGAVLAWAGAGRARPAAAASVTRLPRSTPKHLRNTVLVSLQRSSCR
ncbi:MAG: hypothetical protein JWP75_1083 [Frondihabitans sp.]|nr:hypothetical protein [Frondihabitans sp.]